MTKTIWTLLILTFSSFVFGQEFEKSMYDSLIDGKSYNKELRIRTEISVLSEHKLIRIYQDSSQIWFLEKYISNGQRDEYLIVEELDEFNETTTKNLTYLTHTKKIITKNLGKRFYKSWLELLTTNILDLPSLQNIQYKLGIKKVIEENGQYEIIDEVVIGPNDGIHYIIEMKDRNQFNLVEIDNPSFYITSFPKIDEFKYLDKFLNLIEEILESN